jgi:hypothetical protein
MGIMEILYTVLIAVHIVCWIGALVLINPISQEIRKGASHAIAAALLTGLILVGIGEAADLRDYNHIKIGIKLVVALVATVVAFIVAKKDNPNPQARTLFGLVSANILLAILW